MTPAEEQRLREAFERAATRHADKAKMDFTRLKGRDEYKYLRLEFMWLGWQLAHEQALGDKTSAPADEPAAKPEYEDPLA